MNKVVDERLLIKNLLPQWEIEEENRSLVDEFVVQKIEVSTDKSFDD